MSDRIAVLGGGTGLFTALSGLRHHDVDLSAIVTMADSGGSSGRLRDEFGTLPAGDVRRCLVALAADDSVGMLLRQLFEYRFERGEGLIGHSFGNLLLTALNDLVGGMDGAILEAAHLLRVKGRVLPVTLTNSHLHAVLNDGRLLDGESAIDLRRDATPIQRVYLEPDAEATPEAIQAILDADMVVVGPGDLYTSIVPNLLVRGIREAIAQSTATTVYVCNLMTKHGETDGFAASDFLRVVSEYLGDGVLDGALLNYYESFPTEVLERYAAQHSHPVSIDQGCYRFGLRLMVRPIAAAGTLVRHDSEHLAEALIDLMRETRTPVVEPAGAELGS
jgi:uncharacterized cofD-like protein